jgi:MYXO-CTERM domain-containing protein
MPNFGEWVNIVISYTIGASDPLIGQQLIVAFGAPAVQSNFDMVTIDATPTIATTPEPASYAMMAAGLGLLGLWQRRRKSAK